MVVPDALKNSIVNKWQSRFGPCNSNEEVMSNATDLLVTDMELKQLPGVFGATKKAFYTHDHALLIIQIRNFTIT